MQKSYRLNWSNRRQTTQREGQDQEDCGKCHTRGFIEDATDKDSDHIQHGNFGEGRRQDC